jgi:hypothetical protein
MCQKNYTQEDKCQVLVLTQINLGLIVLDSCNVISKIYVCQLIFHQDFPGIILLLRGWSFCWSFIAEGTVPWNLQSFRSYTKIWFSSIETISRSEESLVSFQWYFTNQIRRVTNSLWSIPFACCMILVFPGGEGGDGVVVFNFHSVI